MDRVFALLSAAMFAVMLSSVALFLMIVEGRAAALVLMPAEAAQSGAQSGADAQIGFTPLWVPETDLPE